MFAWKPDATARHPQSEHKKQNDKSSAWVLRKNKNIKLKSNQKLMACSRAKQVEK